MNRTYENLIAKLNQLVGISCLYLFPKYIFRDGKNFEGNDNAQEIIDKFKNYRQLEITVVGGGDRLHLTMNGAYRSFDFGKNDAEDKMNYDVITTLISEFTQ